jgi:hypothetical protein
MRFASVHRYLDSISINLPGNDFHPVDVWMRDWDDSADWSADHDRVNPVEYQRALSDCRIKCFSIRQILLIAFRLDFHG